MVAIGEQPLVSIITPVYNGAKYLEELIQSVLQQDYPNIEHIIIDDGSTDDGATVAILKRYPHLRWWSRENKGQYATMNDGLIAAQGELVGLISADDKYVVPSAIRAAVEYWEAHPNCDVVYGRWLYINECGDLLRVQTQLTGTYPLWMFGYIFFILHCSMFVRREVFQDSVLFDDSLRFTGDWDWIQRLILAGRKFGFVNQHLAMYRFHSGQAISTANTVSRDAFLSEQRRICAQYGINYYLLRSVSQALGWRSRAMNGAYALKTSGLKGLTRLVLDWKRRH